MISHTKRRSSSNKTALGLQLTGEAANFHSPYTAKSSQTKEDTDTSGSRTTLTISQTKRISAGTYPATAKYKGGKTNGRKEHLHTYRIHPRYMQG